MVWTRIYNLGYKTGPVAGHVIEQKQACSISLLRRNRESLNECQNTENIKRPIAAIILETET